MVYILLGHKHLRLRCSKIVEDYVGAALQGRQLFFLTHIIIACHLGNIPIGSLIHHGMRRAGVICAPHLLRFAFCYIEDEFIAGFIANYFNIYDFCYYSRILILNVKIAHHTLRGINFMPWMGRISAINKRI